MSYYMFNSLGMFEVTRESLTDKKHRLGTIAYNSDTRVWIQVALQYSTASKPKNRRWITVSSEDVPAEY
ncbi:hypothetical protein, partial [Aquabacterium sp.]|uniref:hypothetical protein n=1 Tax=Aquabacterium sp. TaxID=1872578 RepID=UPI0025BE7B2B